MMPTEADGWGRMPATRPIRVSRADRWIESIRYRTSAASSWRVRGFRRASNRSCRRRASLRSRELTADEAVPRSQQRDLLGEEGLEVRLDAVLDEARIGSELMGGVVQHLVDLDDEPVVALRVLHHPALTHPTGHVVVVGRDHRE